MEQIEQQVKLESETLLLKRQFKYATDELSRIKADVAELISTKERVTREITERNEDLTKILNDISNEKLTWALERQAQMDEISTKNAQADNILKRKSELNAQEEEIRQIEAKNTDVLNENRRLELKIKGDMTALEAKENEIKNYLNIIEDEKVKLSKDKEDFKSRVVKVLQEVNEL